MASRLLHAGRLGLSGRVPNGQTFIANPMEVWLLRSSRATIAGRDLGELAPLPEQVSLGDFWIPQRGLFAFGGWETRGERRPWEAAFHFAQSPERYEGKLDEDWSDEDVARAKAAHEARDVAALEALPGVPPATYDQLTAFAQHLGYDFDAGPNAEHRRPGLFARLFGKSR